MLIGRRKFLKINLGVAGAFGHGLAFGSPQTAREFKVAAFLHDLDSAEQIDAAGIAAVAAEQVLDIRQDMDRVWESVLLPKLRASQIYVAGFTNRQKAFVLQEAALDYGYRIVSVQNGGGDFSKVLDHLAVAQNNTEVHPASLLSGSERIAWVLAPTGVNFRPVS